MCVSKEILNIKRMSIFLENAKKKKCVNFANVESGPLHVSYAFK